MEAWVRGYIPLLSVNINVTPWLLTRNCLFVCTCITTLVTNLLLWLCWALVKCIILLFPGYTQSQASPWGGSLCEARRLECCTSTGTSRACVTCMCDVLASFPGPAQLFVTFTWEQGYDVMGVVVYVVWSVLSPGLYQFLLCTLGLLRRARCPLGF